MNDDDPRGGMAVAGCTAWGAIGVLLGLGALLLLRVWAGG